MSEPRFHVETLSAGRVQLCVREVRHALPSRRLSAGDSVVLFDGQGRKAVGHIVCATRTTAEVDVGEATFRPRPEPCLALAVALPKGPRQDVLIEKCTELGVACLLPLVTERSVSFASAHRLAKWRRTTIEAAKQCGQDWLPELREPQGIEEILRTASSFDRRVVATIGKPGLQTAVKPITGCLAAWRGLARILAFVGPEGGWTQAELDRLTADAEAVSLGPNILRIETAAIALAAAVHGIQDRRA